MNVLVVDDSVAARFIITKIMRELGHQIQEAKDGVEALSSLSGAGGFELALVDWNMPNMNGLELVTNIRKDPKYNNMKVIMVTTETEMVQVVRAIEAGANEYIMKPFTKDMVTEKIRIVGL